MQSPVVTERVRAERDSRVERLLASYPNDDGRVVDELFLASLSRPASVAEKDVALAALAKNRSSTAAERDRSGRRPRKAVTLCR